MVKVCQGQLPNEFYFNLVSSFTSDPFWDFIDLINGRHDNMSFVMGT